MERRKLKYFSNNGLIVHHPNPEGNDYFEADQDNPYGMGARQPVIYHPGTRDVYVGGPGWYHQDTYRHHGIDRDWNDPNPTHEGYFNGNDAWGGGPLTWYGRDPEDHAAVEEALVNAGYAVPPKVEEEPEDEYDWNDDDGADWIPNEGQ